MVLPRLYTDLAGWWQLLSDPADYAEEAAIFRSTVESYSATPPRTVLELGSGGGNNASHLSRHYTMTLVDLAPGMLDVSRTLNPTCEHLQGDMRSVRLGRTFDVVFIHDAIAYLSTREDLHAALATAFVHCRPGGVALFVPDHTTESFSPSTDHGGHDREARGLRYLEWVIAPEPGAESYRMIMVYVLREASGEVRTVTDVHVLGLFPRTVWLDAIAAAGFRPHTAPFDHSELEPGLHELFVGIRPG